MSLIPNFDTAGNAISNISKGYGSFSSTINQLIPETTTPVPSAPIQFNVQNIVPDFITVGASPYTQFTMGRSGKYSITLTLNWDSGPLPYGGIAGFFIHLIKSGIDVPNSTMPVINPNAVGGGIPCPAFCCQWVEAFNVGDTLEVMMNSGLGVGQGFQLVSIPGGIDPAQPSATINILEIA
jgi:hypothetical protein